MDLPICLLTYLAIHLVHRPALTIDSITAGIKPSLKSHNLFELLYKCTDSRCPLSRPKPSEARQCPNVHRTELPEQLKEEARKYQHQRWWGKRLYIDPVEIPALLAVPQPPKDGLYALM